MIDELDMMYTEDARELLEKLKNNYASIIEEEVKDFKYVPGDKPVEVTASDIDHASQLIKLVRVNRSRFNDKVYLISKIYIAIGLISILFGLVRTYLMEDMFVLLGIMMVIAGYITLEYFKYRERMFYKYSYYRKIDPFFNKLK